MNERVETVKSWLIEQVGCPYIYGGTGKACTPDYRRARMDQYPQYAEMIKRNCPRLMGKASACAGCKWAKDGVGRLAYDCAQLTRFAMAQVGIALVSGANSQWQKTAFAVKGEIRDMPYGMMCLVYREDSDGKKHHTGVYCGDGYVIHAKGHDYGVVREQLDKIDKPLTHYGIPAGLYTDTELRAAGIDPSGNVPTLRRGSKGELVKQLQRTLNFLLDENLTVDGIFGAKTEAAVMVFQSKMGLKADGVVGPKTWAELGVIEPEEPEEPDEDEAPEEPGESEWPIPDTDESFVRVPRGWLEMMAGMLEQYARDIRDVCGGN
ncbi:MAG: peptidoglycan-binding protein [Clostridia bacterium]|nr:peptidoglycan-binding protein [Clostridia bacterium]